MPGVQPPEGEDVTPSGVGVQATASGDVGLSADEAQVRLDRAGPNQLPSPPRPSAWRKLFAEFVHFFALMLWVAGGLAFLAGMPQLGVAIFVAFGLIPLVSGLQALEPARRIPREDRAQ